MKAIKRIDKSLSTLVNSFQKEAENFELARVCQFKLNTKNSNIPWKKIEHPGIYLFEVKTAGSEIGEWIEDFREKWEHEDYLRKFVPNTKKKRIARHQAMPEWMPIYLGKSKNVSARVHEHLHMKLTRNTFGLKLFERKNLKRKIFRLSTLRLEVENYDLLMPKVESWMRDRFNPILGR